MADILAYEHIGRAASAYRCYKLWRLNKYVEQKQHVTLEAFDYNSKRVDNK